VGATNAKLQALQNPTNACLLCNKLSVDPYSEVLTLVSLILCWHLVTKANPESKFKSTAIEIRMKNFGCADLDPLD